MTSLRWVIDGYNLLFAAGFGAKEFGRAGLRHARDRLLRLLADKLSAEDRALTLVVFDAREPPPNALSELVVQGITVRFAVNSPSADEAIRELLPGLSPRGLTVVSSDHNVQAAARRRGVAFMDCDDFLDRRAKTDASPSTPSPTDRPTSSRETPLAPDDVKAWLTEFGLDD
jgi:predicted RNA-binding protein with PIN domain